jgi:putative sugar O-methyltransferase
MFSKIKNIKRVELQSPPKSLWSTLKNAYLRKRNFKSFWIKLDKKNLSEEIIKTTNLFVKSDSYKLTSKYWRHLIINHFRRMSQEKKVEDDLIVISRLDYSGFTFLDENSIKSSCEKIKKESMININLFQKHSHLNLSKSISYNLVLLILYENIKSKEIFTHYEKINKDFYKEHCPEITINNKNFTQHLLISMFEYEKIETLVKNIKEPIKILELGAGYGRTANTILSIKENAKYVIADFPPAIVFSKKNLTKHYPNKKISSAFNVKTREEMKKLFIENDILFIFPHQLSLFENKFFDISLAIGCLQEMEPKQVKHYMSLFEKISNFLYFKVWEYSGLPYSFYQYYSVYEKSDYSIKENWIEHFKDRCVIPSNQFELGFQFKE